MIKGLVTVVLPIYNVEKYLDRCIESVVNQTYTNLEIILVDDGSPDSCPQMCDAWAEKDSRIKVIHKPNAGLGMARNTGIENANGEYICFFDSDDWVDETTIEKAYTAAEGAGAEMVVFGLDTVDSTGTVVRRYPPADSKLLFTGSEVRDEFLPEFLAPDPFGDGSRKYYMSSCVLLYSMEAINRTGWRFVSERQIISEDVYSLMDLMSSINSVAIVPQALYHYRVNQSSISRKYMPGRYEKVRHFYLENRKLCLEKGYSDDILHRLSEPFLSFAIAAMKQEIAADIPFRQKIKELRRIVEDETIQQVLGQNKKDNARITRKILFFAMRNRLYPMIYLMLRMKASKK